jgi:hypothetical protein
MHLVKKFLCREFFVWPSAKAFFAERKKLSTKIVTLDKASDSGSDGSHVAEHRSELRITHRSKMKVVARCHYGKTKLCRAFRSLLCAFLLAQKKTCSKKFVCLTFLCAHDKQIVCRAFFPWRTTNIFSHWPLPPLPCSLPLSCARTRHTAKTFPFPCAVG